MWATAAGGVGYLTETQPIQQKALEENLILELNRKGEEKVILGREKCSGFLSHN